MKRLDDLLNERIAIGKFYNSHGLNGELKFQPYTNLTETIYNLGDVMIFNPEKRSFFFSKIVNVRPLNKNFILHLNGLSHISEAEKLIGFEVLIKVDELPDLDDDEYYYYQLFDCEVFYEDGEYVGKVSNVITTGANEVLAVEKQIDKYNKEETLFPIVKEFVTDVDFDTKKITVRRMEFYGNDTEDKD